MIYYKATTLPEEDDKIKRYIIAHYIAKELMTKLLDEIYEDGNMPDGEIGLVLAAEWPDEEEGGEE